MINSAPAGTVKDPPNSTSKVKPKPVLDFPKPMVQLFFVDSILDSMFYEAYSIANTKL